MGVPVVGDVRWMAFSGSGSRLAVRDNNGVTVHDFRQARPIFTFVGYISECAFSADGLFLACGGHSVPEWLRYLHFVQVWDVERNEIVCSLDFPPASKRLTSFHLEFSPDSSWLAVVREDGLVSVIHIATGKATYLEQRKERYFESMPSCFFQETCVLAYTYLDEAIKMVDLNSGQTLFTKRVDDVFELIGCRRTDNNILVTHHGKDDYDNQIAVIDTKRGTIAPLIRGRRGYRWSILNPTLSGTGEYLAAIVYKETRSLLLIRAVHAVTIWDVQSGALIREIIVDERTSQGLTLSVSSIVFAPAGMLLVGRRGSIEQIQYVNG